MKKIQAIDFFCGAGGLTNGLLKAGIDVKAGIDIDPYCKYPYEYNNKVSFIEKDISNLHIDDIKQFIDPNIPLLLSGCAPCQPFSSHSHKYNKNKDNDKRWSLLSYFYKFIELLEPEYVTVENVPNIINKDVFKNFVKNLKRKGYHVSYASLGCSNYGLPQARYRLVLIASKQGKINLPTPNNKTLNTVKKAIGDLEPLVAGQVSENDPLHRCRNLENINLKRIRQSKPSGTWQDWDYDILPECYKRESGASYTSVYGRMSWDKPSPTITTQAFSYGSGRYGHPTQDRALSLREMAILQTFPMNYKFFKETSNISYQVAGRLIGNAVPVELARLIGKEIVKFNNAL